jgi:ribosome-associated protein YbcJ (S4-like RNA binding protein)
MNLQQLLNRMSLLSHGSGLKSYISITNILVDDIPSPKQKHDSIARQNSGHDDSPA